jgi:hypothetical protein
VYGTLVYELGTYQALPDKSQTYAVEANQDQTRGIPYEQTTQRHRAG